MKRLLTAGISCLLMSVLTIAEAEDTTPTPTPAPATGPGTGMGPGPGMGMGRGMGPGMGPGMGRGMGYNMPTFEEFDLDKSGYLTEEEFIEARTKRITERANEGRMMRGLSNMMEFQDFDTDGDGKVTPDEFSQGLVVHRQKQMQQMQQ